MDKRTRLTIDLGDDQLYRAVRHAAVDLGRPVREIVVEALRRWIEERENAEDIAAIREVSAEATVPWEEVQARIRVAEESEEQVGG